MSRTVQIVVFGDGSSADVYSPYEAVDLVKAVVPGSLRSWSKTDRCWRIVHCVGLLADALRQAGYTVYTTTADGQPWRSESHRQGRGAKPSPSWIEEAFQSCPVTAVDKLRRGLMAIWHPDKETGDSALALRINAAADKRLGKG